MAPERPSKRWLDTPEGTRQPTAVKALWLSLCAGAALAAPLHGQAPDLADLWRVAASTLGRPAAVQEGPTGVFWNPSATVGRARLAAGAEVLQTADVVSLSAILAGVTFRVSRRFSVGVLAGRVSVDELIRTTTSPTSELGEILVYEQFAGAAVGAVLGPARLGLTVRAHESRFDFRSESGLTVDIGGRIVLMPRLTLAGASRFATPDLAGHQATDYYAAAEYQMRTATLWGSTALVFGRYGFTYRPAGAGLEHTLSGGIALQDRLRVDLGLTREQGFGTASWRPVVELAFRAGRYRVSVARGSGLNAVGGVFRIGVGTDIGP